MVGKLTEVPQTSFVYSLCSLAVTEKVESTLLMSFFVLVLEIMISTA